MFLRFSTVIIPESKLPPRRRLKISDCSVHLITDSDVIIALEGNKRAGLGHWGIDLPLVSSAGHHLGGLTIRLLFFCLSFFFQRVLRFFLCIWLLFVGFLAHIVLLV
jgi:hypothetical protein